jgi:hypothetical protein
MARLPDEVVERIKREISVQRLAEARGIQLRRSGKELIGLCPFHKDTNPSLNIDPVKTDLPMKSKRRFGSTARRKATSKPANEIEVTTGFGVEPRSLEVENPKRILSASACEPFHEAIELGLSRGRDATAIWQDLVAENGFDGSYQTVKRQRAQVARKPATAATRGDSDGTRRRLW